MAGRIRYTQEFKMGAVAQITDRGHFHKVGIKKDIGAAELGKVTILAFDKSNNIKCATNGL